MARLLIVDDEDLMRELAKPFFEKRGYRVFYASTGKQGLEMFIKERPDIVLLDLGLPDGDGREVFTKMRELNRQAKIIILTGFTDEEVKDRVLPLGPDAYFTKPCRLPLVDEKIRTMVKV